MHKDVVIVSVYGRGNWLASQLAEKGLAVSLVDVSSKMGRWAPEDWEGPFGYFRTDVFSQDQLRRLTEDDPEESIDQGMCIWLKDGLLEMKGPLNQYMLGNMKISVETQNYLLRYYSLANDQKINYRNKIRNLPFKQTWLAQLAHQLSSNVYVESSKSIDYGNPLPLFSPYYMRRVSRRGYQKGIERCQASGVSIMQNAEVLDLAVNRRSVEGVEVVSDHSGIIFGRQFVWMLSSAETQRLPEKPCNILFPNGMLKSDWLWMRLRVSVELGMQVKHMPTKFIMIEDLNLPWTHANICMAEKTAREGDIDIWLRIPEQQRFHRAYIDKVCETFCRQFSDRLAGLKVICRDMPQDYIYDYGELGPPRFPVFSSVALQHWQNKKFANLVFNNPETWGGLDWQSQMTSQSKVYDKLIGWSIKSPVENQPGSVESELMRESEL